MKHTTWLLLLVAILFTACSKDDGPLEIRYRNLTGKTLLDIQVTSASASGASVKIGDLEPGELSEYHGFDALTVYDIFPAQDMTGRTGTSNVISYFFFDCLVGVTIVTKTSGRITFDIKSVSYPESSPGVEYVALEQVR